MSYSPTSLPRAEDWRDRAACVLPRYLSIRNFWFADDSSASEVREATTICNNRCPVRETCLAEAVKEEDGRGEQSMYGIRGGLTSKQRWLQKKRAGAKRSRAAQAPKPPAPCGTTAAYDRHIRNGEPVDDACREAQTEYRRKRRNARPRAAECGTRSGYQKHQRNGERACEPCRTANTDADRRLRNTGSTKQLTA